jgi:TonB family protein
MKYDSTNLIISQELKSGDMVSLATRKKIRKTVIITHVAVIIMPFLVLMVYQWFKPKPPERIQVRLVQMPSADNSSKRSTVPRQTVVKPKPKRRSVKKMHASTKPKKKKRIVKKTKPKKRISKKRVPKPKSKKRHIKQPKRRILSANDIKISRDVVKTKRTKKLSSTELEKKILKSWKKVNYPIKAATRGSGKITTAYSDTVGAYLEPIWEQPDKISLGGRTPEVTIRLKIAANGRVIGRQIIRRSRIATMNRSIEKLLKNLKYVPAPSDRRAKTVTIIMAIEK